ncbi:hypothetical protein BKA80DRAFT_275576 [Phyllosticta citrichinensis]
MPPRLASTTGLTLLFAIHIPATSAWRPSTSRTPKSATSSSITLAATTSAQHVRCLSFISGACTFTASKSIEWSCPCRLRFSGCSTALRCSSIRPSSTWRRNTLRKACAGIMRPTSSPSIDRELNGNAREPEVELKRRTWSLLVACLVVGVAQVVGHTWRWNGPGRRRARLASWSNSPWFWDKIAPPLGNSTMRLRMSDPSPLYTWGFAIGFGFSLLFLDGSIDLLRLGHALHRTLHSSGQSGFRVMAGLR